METKNDKDCGGNIGGGPPESPSPMAKTTGRGIDENHGVSPFLIKLYKMVNDKSTNSIISWGSSCTTFMILDEQQFISEILPCYFKTTPFESFVSQLYNYGFKKKTWNQLEFEHEHFQEGKQCLLKTIKRNIQDSNVANNTTSSCIPTNELETTYAIVKTGENQIKTKIHRFQDDIEKTFNEVRNITEAITNKLIFTFSEGIGQKGKFLDIDRSIDFVDIEKDLVSIYDQFEVSESDDVDGFMTLSELKEKESIRHAGGGLRVTRFLDSLYDMVEKEDIDYLVSWNLPYRDSFIISDVNKFTTDVLPMYFNHTNFSSFNRQLSIYGFKKISHERCEYANEWFIGGRYDLLSNIKRRGNVLHLMSSISKCPTTQVEKFIKRLKTIQQGQEEKIIWLSNYEEQMKGLLDEFKEMVTNMANTVDKMILKSNQKLEKCKKTKLDHEENNAIGNGKGQDLEVDELRDNHGSLRDNHNVDAQSYFQNMGWTLKRMMNSWSKRTT